jgi:hypothetical protein
MAHMDNYVKKLIELKDAGKLPAGDYKITIIHEKGCSKLKGGDNYCDCDATILWQETDFETEEKWFAIPQPEYKPPDYMEKARKYLEKDKKNKRGD